eukprot:SAG25_NODE_323_length_9809_cov_4.314212_6_plen_226_part_00
MQAGPHVADLAAIRQQQAVRAARIATQSPMTIAIAAPQRRSRTSSRQPGRRPRATQLVASLLSRLQPLAQPCVCTVCGRPCDIDASPNAVPPGEKAARCRKMLSRPAAEHIPPQVVVPVACPVGLLSDCLQLSAALRVDSEGADPLPEGFHHAGEINKAVRALNRTNAALAAPSASDGGRSIALVLRRKQSAATRSLLQAQVPSIRISPLDLAAVPSSTVRWRRR